MAAVLAALLSLVSVLHAQAPKLDRVIGEVTAIDANAKQISVKSDSVTAVAATVG